MDKKGENQNFTNGLVTEKHPRIATFFKALDCMLDQLEQVVKRRKLILNGELYLTDKEVAERLKISRRTLLEYRNNGRISFYQVGGKITYKESDIQKMLDANYKEAYRVTD